jgi:hypothetical protein
MLSPFALLSFEQAKIAWAITNLGLSIGMFALVRGSLSDRSLFVILLVFLCSTPVRNSVGNGQQSIICLFLYLLGVYLANNGRQRLAALSAGFGAFKFSFGIPMIFSFDRNNAKNVIMYAIPTVFGIMFWMGAFHRGLIETSLLPLTASGKAIGSADLLSLLRHLGFSQTLSLGIPIVVLIVVVVIQRVVLPIPDALDIFSFYALLSLLLIYHSSYDQVFLLGCTLVTIASKFFPVRCAMILVVAYFWFGLKALSLVTAWAPSILANQILLWVLFLTLAYELRYGRPKVEGQSESRRSPGCEPRTNGLAMLPERNVSCWE